jgi:hypothetical protein
LTLQLPSDVEKEAEAKKGVTKLLLFHICGKLNDDSTSFGNLSYPEPSQGMKIVLDSARPTHTTGFSDLIRNTCATAKELDLMNIRSHLILIVFINKATALHLTTRESSIGRGYLAQQQSQLDRSLPLPTPTKCIYDQQRALQ